MIRRALRVPMRVVGGLLVMAGWALIAIGLLAIGVARGFQWDRAAYEVGRVLR